MIERIKSAYNLDGATNMCARGRGIFTFLGRFNRALNEVDFFRLLHMKCFEESVAIQRCAFEKKKPVA
ncbi:hypothetical protein QR680_012471 [Steinernema hermaphroditum]|uniref:Uncharacterized protein n=1 Tax=Steinernema hermaphroditum TaxID=289476 RepID=A0AA39M0T8_9BILA|nr:hypothetical protein QR680_012471 [Steinernema hermaphroditum]